MADHVKVYEEKKSFPVWAWLVPLLLVLALLAYFLLHRSPAPEPQAALPTTSTPATGTLAAVGKFPDLGTVHFDTDKATLTAEGQATLDKAASALKDNPNAHMRLEGYTDSTGTDPHNQTLSQQRAYSVANYLKAKGIDGSRLTGDGFGTANPAETNATAAGKADNRRVELFSQQ